MSAERKAKRALALEQEQLRRETIALQYSLDELYARFDTITDPVQVDACIYEMNAVMARYNYALKCLKAFELS